MREQHKNDMSKKVSELEELRAQLSASKQSIQKLEMETELAEHRNFELKVNNAEALVTFYYKNSHVGKILAEWGVASAFCSSRFFYYFIRYRSRRQLYDLRLLLFTKWLPDLVK